MKRIFILSALLNVSLISIFAFRRLTYKEPDTRTPYEKASTETFKILPKDSGSIFFIGNSIIRDYPVQEIFGAKNRGVGLSYTFDTYQRLDDVLARHPSKIFILEGINDLRDGISFDSSLGQYKKIIKKLKGTDYHVISILPAPSRPDLEPTIKRYNDSLKAASNFIDVYDQMKDSSYYYDGLHPDAKGYSKMTELLKPYIK